MAKGQTEQAHQAKKSLQRRGKSWLQRQNQLLSLRQGWDYKSRKRSLRTGDYPRQADTDLLSQNEHCVAIKPALKRSAWDSKVPPKQTLLWTAKESDVIFFLYISATKHKVAVAATGLKSRVKLDLPLVGAGKSGREGEDVKGGEEETKAEWQTEASAAHCHWQFPPGRALPPPRLTQPHLLTAFGDSSVHSDMLSHQWMGSPVPAEQQNGWKAHQGWKVCW